LEKIDVRIPKQFNINYLKEEEKQLIILISNLRIEVAVS